MFDGATKGVKDSTSKTSESEPLVVGPTFSITSYQCQPSRRSTDRVFGSFCKYNRMQEYRPALELIAKRRVDAKGTESKGSGADEAMRPLATPSFKLKHQSDPERRRDSCNLKGIIMKEYENKNKSCRARMDS